MITGRVAFIRGTDRYGALPPEGFPYRFAVLTWLDEAGSQADPWDLAARAFYKIFLAVGAPKIVEEHWERRERGVHFYMAQGCQGI